jgi:hypothetical protein
MLNILMAFIGAIISVVCAGLSVKGAIHCYEEGSKSGSLVMAIVAMFYLGLVYACGYAGTEGFQEWLAQY